MRWLVERFQDSWRSKGGSSGKDSKDRPTVAMGHLWSLTLELVPAWS